MEIARVDPENDKPDKIVIMPTAESSRFSLELGFTPELIGRHATRARWLGVAFIIHGLQWQGVPGIGWGILSGLFGIIIAILVFTAWPASSEWFIGILLGVDFLVMGVFLNVFASACRRDVESYGRSRGDSLVPP